MSQAKLGAIKARETIYATYGRDYYQRIGGLNVESWYRNGKKPRGFSTMTPEKRSAAGKKGGRKSRKPFISYEMLATNAPLFEKKTLLERLRSKL